MRVMVTGGAGFIGSHSVKALLARGNEVVVLDDFSTGLESRLQGLAGVRLVRGDLREVEALDQALEGVERVLHLAAIPSVARSVADPFRSHDVNATGTVRLLEACRAHGVRRIVVASSSSVYGDAIEPGPKHELLAPRPASPYAASKLATESYALAWSRSMGLEAVAVRYFNIFGPGQDPNGDYAAVIPRFITQALKDEALVIYGDGLQTRDFTFVANAVDANLKALDGPEGNGEAFNIACGEAASLLDLAERIGKIHGTSLKIEHRVARAGDVRHSKGDVSKALRILGWKPRVTLDEGLRLAYQSYARAVATGSPDAIASGSRKPSEGVL